MLPSSSTALLSAFAFCAYLGLVAQLRYRRRRLMREKFNYPNRASLSRMTVNEAYEIQLSLAELEFPKLYSTSVFFALFKTYGIPSISKLLVATGQLGNEETASKRAADTGVILTEIVLNHPKSERTTAGIARMNYLHDRYRKSGKISDDDMLYTLSLFTLEPARWVNRFEWRQLTDMELCATGTFWKDLGDAMEIPYHRLRSSNSGWTDGLHWLEDLREWSEEYELENMVPAESNRKMADGTIGILQSIIPPALHETAKKFIAALLEPRLRKSMKLDEPPPIYTQILESVMRIRQLALRYLTLPRPRFMRVRFIEDAPDPKTGNLHSLRWVAHPWYIKDSFASRWGYYGLVTRIVGGKLPGDDGKKYQPDGYKILEIGPTALVGKGQEEMLRTQWKLDKMDRGGCPFRFS